ncbi:MAG: acyl-CoA dehydrogenase, partial [Nitriliruptorales bacterium]|nr:acyl-CoA dehydrogenase [Nitriliruptorales bacterium]
LIVDGTNHGVHCLVVPIRNKKGKVLDGVRIEDCGDKLGLHGVDNGRLWFDHVRVPRSALLNRHADVDEHGTYSSPIDNPNRRFFTMLGTLVQGRVSVGGAAISASKSALAIAIRYGLKRRQFGPEDAEEVLLLDYRMHQRRLLPLLAKTVALHAAQRDLVARLHQAFSTDSPSSGASSQADDDEQAQRELESLAAGIKAIATWHATTTIQICREACGGAGYLFENRFASLKADTDVFTTFEGDNHVLLQLVIKGRLTKYRDQFSEMNPIELIRFVADQAVDTVVEKTFLRAMAEAVQDLALDDRETVRKADYQLELFRAREGHLVHALARRLKKGMDKGLDPFEVFNAVQDHLVLAARAHVNRKVLESFQAQIASTEDAALAGVLGDLSALYALSTLQEHRGWFLTHGRMSPARAKAIVEAVNDLCLDVRPHAAAIVDAFAIPSQWVDVPMLDTA